MVDLDLLAYLESFLTEERRNRFREVLDFRTKFLTIAAEDVFQQHNASAIVRSSDVFGLQEVHLIEGRFGKRVDKNIAMGAQQWVDIKSYKNARECAEALKSEGYKIIATMPSGNAIPLDEFTITEKTVLFFGTEKEGLSPEIVQKADDFLQIPMVGFSESLNVSVSAAIILQKLTTDLRRSDLNWRLNEEEKQAKLLDWTKKTIKNVDQIIERYKEASTGQ